MVLCSLTTQSSVVQDQRDEVVGLGVQGGKKLGRVESSGIAVEVVWGRRRILYMRLVAHANEWKKRGIKRWIRTRQRIEGMQRQGAKEMVFHSLCEVEERWSVGYGNRKST